MADKLCDDEGCPHYGTPHVCNPVESKDRTLYRDSDGSKGPPNRVFVTEHGDIGIEFGGTVVIKTMESWVKGTQRIDFQDFVNDFAVLCFGEEHTSDPIARADRWVEEVYELLQANDYPRDRLAALEKYVWSRPRGEPRQEVGGVSVTFNAYCTTLDINVFDAAIAELQRCWDNFEKIQAKHKAKLNDSALP